MSRWRGWVIISLLLALCAVALAAYGSPSHAPTLDERTQSLAAQLRCPVCQGESVADSQSAIAKGIRAVIRRDFARGESEDSIKTQLLASFPDISLAPPTGGIGSIAWLAPPLLVLGGAALITLLILDWRGRGGRPAEPANPAYLARVRRELAGEEALTGE
jgi:cytochrome c-type biogenesis protein CcmH